MGSRARWDTGDYLGIRASTYDVRRREVDVVFCNGDRVSVATKHLVHPRDYDIAWERLEVEEPMHLHIPTAHEPIEIPGFAIRSLTDAEFAAFLARKAEEAAQRVGERLRALRKARGLTAKEVAARAGLAQQTISRVELGQHDVVFSTLEKILAAMGYTLEDILPDEPAETATATTE
jgi:DNA-binding XRE family transcriptional regulator